MGARVEIQRYEATEYRSASLARICDVAAALGIDVAETGRLRAIDAAQLAAADSCKPRYAFF